MKKRVLSLFLALVMTLGLAAPASAAKDDRSDLPEYEILSMLPEKLDRPARPTTLEQADLYSHPAGGGNLVNWTDENTLQEIVELTDSLTAGKTTDTQKMKAIFEWVYQNINYGHEDNTLWGKRFSDLTQEQRKRLWEAGDPYSVYTKRLGICEGYSNLCWLMGTIAGIPVAKLTCYTSMGHARNAALLDGRWVFFDATEAWNTVDPDHSWDLDPYARASSYSAICFYDGVYQMYVARGYEKNIIVSAAFRSGFQCPANVTIPSYATEVSRSAFKGCTDLKSVTIPNGVTTIDGNAFEGCTNLENVDIPNSVTTIAGGVFYGCTSLKSITIPGSVSEISSILFKDCTSLESVTISDGVTKIWQEAFAGCTSLKSITIPGSVTEMEAAFYGCAELESVTIERGVPSIGFAAFQDCTGLKNITIPDTVTTIEGQAFWGCTALESVTIPEGVTTIEKLAFAECTNLKQVDLPDSLTDLDPSAFYGSPCLQNMTLPGGLTTIPAYSFRDRTDLTSYDIPYGVTTIGSQAFQGCTNLTSITIPDSVTFIDNYAFSGCSSLKSVTIPAGLTALNYSVFQGCSSLTSVTIPDSVTKIGDSAFASCTSLTDVTLPSGAIEIGHMAFVGTPWWDNWLKTQGEFAVMNNMLLKYQGAGGAVTVPGGITHIVGDAFYLSDVTSVTIPSGVTCIGDSAFSYCSKLKSVSIPGSVKSIGDSAFLNCIALENITIPEGVTTVGFRAFDSCTGLKTATISNSVTELGYRVFDCCTSLTSASIGSGVTSIKFQTFNYCKQLTSVGIPSGVTDIDDGAFKDCISLTQIYYGGSADQWRAIQIGDKNKTLTSATIHYNSVMPQQPAAVGANTAYASTQTVLVNGRAVEFQCYALKDANGNDTNYIKLRDIASILNGTAVQFEVGWNGAVNIETGKGYTPNGSEMSTPFFGNRTYETASAPTNVNGRTAALEAIVLKDDQGGAYTYYKLRDLGANLGFRVDWSAEKGIFIETK